MIARLASRKLLQQTTANSISPCPVYAGFDPTAASLHVGNLATIMALVQCSISGFTPICLIGGATAFVGDPSGKSHQRNLLPEAAVEKNVASISRQLELLSENIQVYSAKHNAQFTRFQLVNNMSWFSGFNLLDFLRRVGRYSRVGQMLARDSVKGRMASADGISFTEFTYQLLQAYDFWHLYSTRGCLLQIGGSDQWGNITAGLVYSFRS